MRVHLIAVGRLRSGPELTLFNDYTQRFNKIGRQLGLGPINMIEVEDKKSRGMSAEYTLIEKAIPNGSFVCVLDERGKIISSPDFAAGIAAWRDQGYQDITFIIGGADGIDPDLRTKSDAAISFGKMVWPHMLVRVMLSEQLYRAASILVGAPYHRI